MCVGGLPSAHYSGATPNDFRAALAGRVLVADGAMGTMLQAADLSVEADFQGLEGCNEILDVTRPDVVRAVHEAYLAAGSDCIETNTFGANPGNLGDYDIQHRISELSEAGARIARHAADACTTEDQPRYVLGSIGPSTKLPTLGHTHYTTLREAYRENAAGLILGGADALIVETCQDLLQTKAAIVGSHRAMAEAGRSVPLICQVTVETTGTMLLGSEIGAALTALEPLGVDLIGLNCATGPAEMTEHLRFLARHARVFAWSAITTRSISATSAESHPRSSAPSSGSRSPKPHPLNRKATVQVDRLCGVRWTRALGFAGHVDYDIDAFSK
jgi:5-methyltetrahydrofolate--homocysteine methyltransferase